jgi:hypothetical protein
MNKRTALPLMIFILTVLIISEAHATGKGSYKRAFRKDSVGTWVNPEYSKYSELPYAILDVISDSEMECYQIESSEWASTTKLIIDDRWVEDQEPYTYYKVYVEMTGGFIRHELWRIDDSKNTLEINWFRSSYPDEVDPKSGYYLIYYRK